MVFGLKWLVGLYDGSELFCVVARQSSRCNGVSIMMSNYEILVVSIYQTSLHWLSSHLFPFPLRIQRIVIPPLHPYDDL